MLTILIVIINGVTYPTFAWHDDNRFVKENVFEVSKNGYGHSARQACNIVLGNVKKRMPDLEVFCVEQT